MNNQEAGATGVVDDTEQRSLKRLNQTTTERLIEMLTGMSATDPRFIERIKEDKQIVRKKYDLPPEEMRTLDPREYYHSLLQIAVRNGLNIKPKDWAAEFFIKNPETDAKFEPDTMTIVYDFDEENIKKIRRSLIKFEHELVHGLQALKYPNMPIEVKEYEAFIINTPVAFIEKSSPSLRPSIFGNSLMVSVMNWYERQEKEPKWDNPEWFLKNVDHPETKESSETE